MTPMKKFLSLVILALALSAHGQSQPSAKATAKTSALVLLPKTSSSGGWKTILSNNIKTSSQKDIFCVVSAEIGLFTSTTTSSKNMISDSSVGQAEVKCRVLVDGREMEPGVVVFGRRTQTLTSTLEGQIGNSILSVTNSDGTISTTVDLTTVQPETIELILDSLQATSFSFVSEDLQSGVHSVQVQAKIDTIGSAQQGQYSALALVGKATMTAESVRLIRGEDVVDVP